MIRQLLTAEDRARLPRLHAKKATRNPMVHARLYHAAGTWAWWVIAFDGKDLCFGIVDGSVREYGYFRLSELEPLVNLDGQPAVVRDRWFVPCRVNMLPPF